MPPRVKPEHVAFYIQLLQKIRATEDWKGFMEQGAFNQAFMSGDEFKKWLGAADKMHFDLMKQAGFLPKTN
jgi:tripartite-type tricarboxylate transporter receptor subunit TctC